MKCQVCNNDISRGEAKRKFDCATSGCKLKAEVHQRCAPGGMPTYCGKCLSRQSSTPAVFARCFLCGLPVIIAGAEARQCATCREAKPFHGHCARSRLEEHCRSCQLEAMQAELPAIVADLHLPYDPERCPSCLEVYASRQVRMDTPPSIDAHNIISREAIRGESSSERGVTFDLNPHRWMCKFYEICLRLLRLDRATPICTREVSLDLVIDRFLDDAIEKGEEISLASDEVLIRDLLRWNEVVEEERASSVWYEEGSFGTDLQTGNVKLLASLFGEGALMSGAFCQTDIGTSQCQTCESLQDWLSLIQRWRILLWHHDGSLNELDEEAASAAIVFLGRLFCIDKEGRPVDRLSDVSPYALVSVTLWQIKRHLDYYRTALESCLFNITNKPVAHIVAVLLRLWPAFSGFYALNLLQVCTGVDVSDSTRGTTTRQAARKALGERRRK